MNRKALVSLLLALVMLAAAAVPAFAAVSYERAAVPTVADLSVKAEDGNGVAAFVRNLLTRLKALLARIFPCLRDDSVTYYPTDDVQKTYNDAVSALQDYTDYGIPDVQATPLADVSFDKLDSLVALASENAGLSDVSGAKLVTGRFGLRRALEFTSPDTYLSLPDLGEQDALTISLWVNVRDLQTRENTDAPRVSTLLDTETGAGRVTLKFVHTGTPSYESETGEAVMGTNSTRLVFSVDGNGGGQYAENSVCANNTQFCNLEYTTWKDHVGGPNDWVFHPEGHCWFHIGVVYEPEKGDVTFYHCGKFDSTKHFDTAVGPVLNGVRIGAGYAENESFDGIVDDIRLYGSALTQADMDILADYERDLWVNRTVSDWEESATVLYVDGATGSDENPGTQDAPFATVKKGVASIAAPGTKLIVAPGVYHETSMNLRTSGTELQPVIIEAAQPGKTVISGAVPFDGWKATNTQSVFENDWSYDYPFQPGTPGNEIIGRSDLLIVDGEPVEPVLTQAELKNDSYYIDREAGKIYLKTEKELGSCTIELALPGENGAGAYLLDTNSSDYVVLRGLIFTGCACRIWDKSMVHMGKAQHVLVEDCTFNNSGTGGLGFDHGSNDRTVEDVLIRRCTFDNDGTGGVSAGFRSMNFTVEDCVFTNIGKKIDWGKYDSPDPATTKMMVSKNVTWRGCCFAHNISNDLWFDNFNWNIDVDNCAFFDNHSGIAVHIEIDIPGVRVKNSVLDGGVRFASAEGAILDNNIIFANGNPLIDNWGDEYRFGSRGPVYSWKNTVLTNNTFYCEKNWGSFFIFDLPPYASFYDLYADGNRFFVKGGLAVEKSYKAIDNQELTYRKLISLIGDKNAKYLWRDPFINDGTVTVGFVDRASVPNGYGARNQVPVALSKPINEACTVYYTVWDYDANTVLRTGELHFDRFETSKTIYVGEYERSILIEISGVQNIARGENSFHFRTGAAPKLAP